MTVQHRRGGEGTVALVINNNIASPPGMDTILHRFWLD